MTVPGPDRPRWWWRGDGGLLLLLGVALAVRILAAPFHGFLADLQAYVDWGELVRHHPTDFYTAGADAFHHGRLVFPTNYPPLTLEVFGGLVQGARWLGADSLSVAGSGWLAAGAKSPAVLADLVCVALLWRWGVRVAGHRRAMAVAALYALAPAVVVDGALWGQTDTLSGCLLLATALAAIRRRPVAAGVLLAAAVMLKPQPAVALPAVAVYLARRWGGAELRRAAVAGGAAVVLVWLPMVVTGHLGEVVAFGSNLADTARDYPAASLNALNLWWLIGAADVHHDAAYLGPLSIDAVGTALTVAIIAGTVALVWRRPSDAGLLLAMAVAVVAFFVVGSLQHERYLVPALPLLAAACLYDLRTLGLYAVASVTVAINLLMVALPSLSAAERVGLPAWWFEVHTTTARAVAGTNLLLLGALMAYMRRSARADSEGSAAVS